MLNNNHRRPGELEPESRDSPPPSSPQPWPSHVQNESSSAAGSISSKQSDEIVGELPPQLPPLAWLFRGQSESSLVAESIHDNCPAEPISELPPKLPPLPPFNLEQDGLSGGENSVHNELSDKALTTRPSKLPLLPTRCYGKSGPRLVTNLTSLPTLFETTDEGSFEKEIPLPMKSPNRTPVPPEMWESSKEKPSGKDMVGQPMSASTSTPRSPTNSKARMSV